MYSEWTRIESLIFFTAQNVAGSGMKSRYVDQIDQFLNS